jgi:para-nitrobenzyl esterase
MGCLQGILAVSLFLWVPLFANNAGPAVQTDSGPVRGKLSADGKVHVFLGIPYAGAPVGTLRWKPPQPASRWTQTRDATSFGARCMQAAIYSDMVFRDARVSEDCLTLNVWAPNTARGSSKLPVMVWIHGGGFQAGASSEPRQDGESLAHQGVIVVSMNYRLGIFGFLATRELAEESPQHATGNYGLLDQLAALQWVQRNIAGFGGDPGNITIFGESAGSFSVNAHMASPLSRTLLARAIGESGGAVGKSALPFASLGEVAAKNESFVRDELHASNLAALRAISAEELLREVSGAEHSFSFQPVVDGYFLPESIPAIFAADKQAKIPMLAGWNKNEARFNTAAKNGKFTLADLKKLAVERFGAQADEFLKVYHASSDEEALQVADDLTSAGFLAFATWAWLEAQVKSGVTSVYRYRFDLDSPGDPYHPVSAGAFHSDEIEYVFGTLDSRQGAKWRSEDYKLSELMQTYWTNFAKSGDPNSSGAAQWPAYNPSDGWQLIHLDRYSAAQPDKQRDRYLFLQKVWTNE